MRAALLGDKEFSDILRRIIKDNLQMDLRDFAKKAGIPGSTIYKIVSEGRAPNLRTLRAIVKCVDKIEGGARGEFIAVIAARYVLDHIDERIVDIEGKKIAVREYPAGTIEDVIVAAIRAEDEGAKAVVCAPIVSSTVERVVQVPIVTIAPKDSVLAAIRVAAKKASL
ncbi:MAG: helix-turn-helix domain-containing protein [Thermoplasmata archaeon]|nr:helix-turn-helix domain-containing protein [Thermoplasmata archaeon]